LKEAYKVQEKMGELDVTQHNGYLFDILMQSVDLAINEVRYDATPIEDWQHTEILFGWNAMTAGLAKDPHAAAPVSSPVQRRTTTRSHRRNISNVSLKSIASIESCEHQTKKKTQITLKRIRLDVLRALAFRHAHKLADAKLQLYVNRFDDDADETMRARHLATEETLETILSESRDQVALADEMLREEVSEKDLEIILSHKCAKMLIQRLRMFTEEKSQEGMIGKQEARTYLKRMKEIIVEINSNTFVRLAESRVSMISTAKSKEHRKTPSDMMHSIFEDAKVFIFNIGEKSEDANDFISIVEKDESIIAGPQIVDAIGDSIVQRELSRTPSGLVITMPEPETEAETERIETYADRKSKATKEPDGYASA